MKGRKIVINENDLRTLVSLFGGNIFGVTFVKKDGTTRRMCARKGITKGVKGTGTPWGPHVTSIRVFDMGKNAFRAINLATTVEFRFRGFIFAVKNEEV
jgi:hypothetical protein